MAEEQKCEKAGGHRLCANNCGFFGSSTTLNLCSKCYKDHCIKEQQMKEAHLAILEGSLKPPGRNSSESSGSSSPSSFSSSSSSSSSAPASASPACDGSSRQEEVGSAAAPPRPNRCGTCRKRVGLTGFKCRCGVIYCGTHRYPEHHACAFDYKAMGREAIAKANPLVKAEKLDKI